MINTSTIITMAAVWTLLVAGMVQFAEISGGVIFAIAFAWFSIGRMIGRSGRRITSWGRQP